MDWRVPDWPAPAEVRALSSQRRGGVSAAPFESLNLGVHVGDSPEAVAENRRRLAAAARLPTEPVWLSQQHGTNVLDLDGRPRHMRRRGRLLHTPWRAGMRHPDGGLPARAARLGFGRRRGGRPCRLARPGRGGDRGDGAGARACPQSRSWRGSVRASAPRISRSAPKSARNCSAPTRKPRRHSSRTRAADIWRTSRRSRAAGSSGSASSGSTAATPARTPRLKTIFPIGGTGGRVARPA